MLKFYGYLNIFPVPCKKLVFRSNIKEYTVYIENIYLSVLAVKYYAILSC